MITLAIHQNQYRVTANASIAMKQLPELGFQVRARAEASS
jgi:hypothetical protein